MNFWIENLRWNEGKLRLSKQDFGHTTELIRRLSARLTSEECEWRSIRVDSVGAKLIADMIQFLVSQDSYLLGGSTDEIEEAKDLIAVLTREPRVKPKKQKKIKPTPNLANLENLVRYWSEFSSESIRPTTEENGEQE